MKSAYFIMELWQTGNVGSHNIKKSKINPKEGFETPEEAEEFLKSKVDEIFAYLHSWDSIAIMKIYDKI